MENKMERKKVSQNGELITNGENKFFSFILNTIRAKEIKK